VKIKRESWIRKERNDPRERERERERYSTTTRKCVFISIYIGKQDIHTEENKTWETQFLAAIYCIVVGRIGSWKVGGDQNTPNFSEN
jgi:hypothetical protein